MKKVDKVVGLVSVVVMVLTATYLVKAKLISTADNSSLYVVGTLFLVVLLLIAYHYLILGFILRRRVNSFKELAKMHSLEHSFAITIFFIPYGKLNSIRGNVNGHIIEVSDESFKPKTDKLVQNVLMSSIVTYTPKKSYNMVTKIYLDGKDVTPNYSQKWIFYRDPFMQVREIEEYLCKL